ATGVRPTGMKLAKVTAPLATRNSIAAPPRSRAICSGTETSLSAIRSGRRRPISEEALSDTQRQGANEWYDYTLYNRLNDKRHGAIVIVMQRLHEDDLPPSPTTTNSRPAPARGAKRIRRLPADYLEPCPRHRDLHPAKGPQQRARSVTVPVASDTARAVVL